MVLQKDAMKNMDRRCDQRQSFKEDRDINGTLIICGGWEYNILLGFYKRKFYKYIW